MEIPVINRMTDSLNTPSLISRLLSSTFELGKLTHAHRYWKWGALFLALVYAFSSLINKIKLIIYYFHNKSKSILAEASEPLLSHFDDAFISDDDENDDVCSFSGSYSSSDDVGEFEDDVDGIEHSYFDDDFNVKGSFRSFSESRGQKNKFKIRRRKSFVENFSLTDLVNGNGVVRLWDGLSLGVVEVDKAFSFLDFNYSEKADNLISGSSVFDPVSNVFVSADSGLSVWDLRTGEKKPTVHSEWRSDRKGKIIAVDSGLTGNVYVRDNVSKRLSVGDVRKVDSPLTEYEEGMWLDADGVSESTRDLRSETRVKREEG